MLENYSTVSDSLRISSDLIHSQSQDLHYSINVKGKLENFIWHRRVSATTVTDGGFCSNNHFAETTHLHFY